MVEDLLKELIEIPSVSGKEKKIAQFVFNYLKKKGFEPKLVVGNNVCCEIGKGKSTLLLNSHLDTVPPSSSWKINPFEVKEVKGKLYGLGSSDTKSSLAAMMISLVELKNSNKKLKGKIIFAATEREEIEGTGMEKLAKKLKFDAAIIGEPTNLDICIAQKGLLKLKIITKGKAAHAANPGGINAISKAAGEIMKLKSLKFAKQHKSLGFPSLQVTIINGGIKSNIIPDRCEFIVDIRTTPVYPNNYLLNLIKKQIRSKIEVESNRIFPKEVGINEKIVQTAKKANPYSKIREFFAISDLAFIEKPGIIFGPGIPELAHASDEYVEISQVKKAVEIYKKTIENFFLN